LLAAEDVLGALQANGRDFFRGTTTGQGIIRADRVDRGKIS